MRRAASILTLLAASCLVPVLLLTERLRRMISPVASAPTDPLFCYSQVLWDDVWQRPQEYASRTARHRRVVYCAPVQVHNWIRTLRGRWSAVKEFRSDGRDLVVLSPLVFSGHFKNRMIFELNCRIVAAHAAPWLRGARTADCVVNTPFAAPVVERLFKSPSPSRPGLRTLAYDVIDDFTVFDWSPAFGKVLDACLMESADVVFTGTYELLKERRVARPEAEFVACGVDFELFSTPAAEPEDLKDLPRPIIGYFGTVSDRLDLDLLDKVARRFPQATLAVVGPVHLSESVLPRGAGNVRYLGLKPHARLPGYAQAFDVGLIPFRLTEAALKLNPVKTLEYLAAGLPVVSTAIPDVVRFFSDAVSVAADADEFAEMVGRCLDAPDPARREAGLELARRGSWEAMTRRINELVAGDAPAKSAVRSNASL